MSGTADTLRAHTEGGSDVDLPFCSTDCLGEWV
jgi:hypothetical protein